MIVIKLLRQGLHRLPGEIGMTFIVDSFSPGAAGDVAHVRDYRYPQDGRPYCIWSIPADGYEIITESPRSNANETDTQA